MICLHHNKNIFHEEEDIHEGLKEIGMYVYIWPINRKVIFTFVLVLRGQTWKVSREGSGGDIL